MNMPAVFLMLWDAAIAAFVWFVYRREAREHPMRRARQVFWFVLMVMPCAAVIMIPIVAQPGDQPGWNRVNQFLTTLPAMIAVLSLVQDRKRR